MKKRIKEHIPNQSLRKLSKETPKLFSVIIITIIFYKKNSLSLSLFNPLQQNIFSVMNFSEENFFVTKKYHIVTKFKFRHYRLC